MRKGFHEPAEKPRRFYKSVAAIEAEGGHGVALDGRRLRTPKGLPLVLPTPALADEVAAEWAAQGQTIEMAQMHVTRLANTAIESIPQAREATADSVARFAGTDLLCYFAEGPPSLVARQQAQWEPVLRRAEAELGLAFVRAAGIVHQAQPEPTIEKVRAHALARDDFGLAGLSFGAALFGSAVLAIGVERRWLAGEAAFDLSRVDEAFQEEKWGVDEEAAERTARLRDEAAMLDRWFRSLSA